MVVIKNMFTLVTLDHMLVNPIKIRFIGKVNIILCYASIPFMFRPNFCFVYNTSIKMRWIRTLLFSLFSAFYVSHYKELIERNNDQGP